jgi:hypothetical protein
LPYSPLKATEKRGDRWRELMGVEQTEIDAFDATPALARTFQSIIHDAIDPFYDRTLRQRVQRAYEQWQAEAQEIVDSAMDPEQLDRLRAEKAEKLTALRAEIDAINEALRVDAGDFDLPEIVVPEPYLRDADLVVEPLIDSRWDFAEQCRRLIASKAYDSDGGGGP